MIRTGAQYIESLRDARTVFVDGARVADVTEHPAFRAAVRSIAGLYDLAAAPENREVMTFPSPATGAPVNASFLLPRTQADLAARRRAHRLWAEATFGLMGRSPDHVPGFITGFALCPDLFARGGARFAEHVVRYHAYLRDRDLYASYVIIPPIVDRSRPAHRQDDPTVYAGVVEERPEGIVVSGAQMLGTGAAISNEVFASCINPLQPGDENYALSFAVPAAAPGLRMIVRRPYAEAAPSVYDYPLSSRFDETDALVIFDRVFVPWERVFVYRDVALTRAQFYDTPAHLLGNFQAQVRFAAKAEFLAGLALRIAEATGVAARRETQTQLGELASYCGMAAGLVVAAESTCVHDPRGFVYPNPTYLYANNWLQATYYQTMVTYLRELSGGGLLQVPSSYRDYLNPEIAADLERYVRSPGLTSVERVKLAKLAWDLVGSEFAGRHQQYELFYAGGRAETTSVRAYRAFDFAGARAMVERCLAGYDLPAKPSAEGETPPAMTSAKERLVAELHRRRGDLIELCAAMVRIPSENPPGNTSRIADFAARYLRARGVRPSIHEPRRGMPNVVATLGRGAPNLVLSGHLDEFPAGEGWSVPPFSGRIRSGRIWGRGAGDMRAGLAVALFITGLVREAGLRPRGTLTVAFASDEETGGTWGTQWLLRHVRSVRGDACLIGESSGTWSVGIGEKGVLWVRLRAEGVSGHAAYALGESAVVKVLAVLRAAERLGAVRGRPPTAVAGVMRRQRAAADRHWGPGTGRIAERLTVNVGTIRGGGQVNLIPARCEADVDFRLPPGLPTATVLAALRRAARGVRGTAIEVLNQCESYVTSPDERLVRLVVDNARALRGLTSLPVVRPGYTDGRFFRRAGIPTVVYGPRVRAMGGPDESIDVRELVDVAAVHLGVVLDYLGIGA